jgi:hypothetical protein
MKLSDIVGHWDLATYPKVALVIFLIVFASVIIRIYARSSGRNLQRYASMAIDEDAPRTTTTDRAD